jgi:hypothetical protein
MLIATIRGGLNQVVEEHQKDRDTDRANHDRSDQATGTSPLSVQSRVLRAFFPLRCCIGQLYHAAMLTVLASVRIVVQRAQQILEPVTPMGPGNTRTLALRAKVWRADVRSASGSDFVVFGQAVFILVEFRLKCEWLD